MKWSKVLINRHVSGEDHRVQSCAGLPRESEDVAESAAVQ